MRVRVRPSPEEVTRMPQPATAVQAVSLVLLSWTPLLAAPAPPASAGGIAWKLPARWTAAPGSAMRVATYAVPAAKGAEKGECAVFFFGPGQGGGIDDNVARWARQFEGAPAAARTTATVAGLRVTRVAVAGTY